MAQPLRVLMVEDDERDAALLLRELQRSHYDVIHERVETPEAMSAALDQEPWDVVLADFSLPRFSAPAALSLLKERAIDLPFIIVSGTIGEEAAVTSLRAGAHDFLVKGALARLAPAIERERREALIRAERKKMRQQLLLSDRMASIGLLAAGVAHEINNPLAILVANLELAAEQLVMLTRPQAGTAAGDGAGGEPPISLAEVAGLLRDAQEAAERVRVIVRDLKMFSRADEEEVSGPVDIHRALESSIRMAANEVRHRARLVRNFGTVPLVEGSEGRLGQVFVNLIVNAAQSMPEGRTETNEIGIRTRTDDAGRAVIEIRDTGSGIRQEILPRIFDDFFTTKPVNSGTGLGLAICRRIITAHGGVISVESKVGRGSTFRVVLPGASAGGTAEAVASPRAAGPAPRAHILVVDDEPMLGVTIQRTLGREHDVTALSSAKEALRLVGGGVRFDLILCDLMMPEMSGMDLHSELIKLDPAHAKTLVFMTGGAFTENASRFLSQLPNPSIRKPFKASELRELVRSLLQ